MSKSTHERLLVELNDWLDWMTVERTGPLQWIVRPGPAWPVEHSFGFHFSRSWLSVETPCRFEAIPGTSDYRLTFPAPITDPATHPQVVEAALWQKLNELDR